MQTTVETPRATAESGKRCINFLTEFNKHVWQYTATRLSIGKLYANKEINDKTANEMVAALFRDTAKQALILHRQAHMPITKEAIKYVPISTCSVLTDVMISGKFVEDGVEKSYDDFLNYCYSVMAAIDEYYFAKQK